MTTKKHLTSIIILNYNLRLYTQNLIESIRRFTPSTTYEIIVVDNGSNDDSLLYLKKQTDVKTITNKHNEGFPKGCNQGLATAKGDEILLLNNDTIVTPRWLDNLRTALYSKEDIGAVSPVTNACSNMQQIDIPYKNTLSPHIFTDIENFAQEFNHNNSHKWYKWLTLVGYCMLIKREVYERIGPLDEVFSPGNYEDDDYSLRIRKAGYELLLCKDTFIHHFGSSTFGTITDVERERYNQINLRNKHTFLQKWHLNNRYKRSYTFISDIKISSTQGRIIEYNSGSTMDLYLLAMGNPEAHIAGTTKNPADLHLGHSFPMYIVKKLVDFPTILSGTYDCIIIPEDYASLEDKENFLAQIETFIAPNGWLVLVNEYNKLVYMQKQ